MPAPVEVIMQRFVFSCLVSSTLFACGGASTGVDAPATSPATFDEQVTLGQKAYGASCAKCHGDAGQGTDKGPRVVGLEEGALARFATAGEVAKYVVAKMPGDAPGTLDAETYLAILAFDLKANGVSLDQKLTLPLAETLTIPH